MNEFFQLEVIGQGAEGKLSSQETPWEEGKVSKIHLMALTKSSSSSHSNPTEKLTTYCQGQLRVSLEEEFKNMFTPGLVNLYPLM